MATKHLGSGCIVLGGSFSPFLPSGGAALSSLGVWPHSGSFALLNLIPCHLLEEAPLRFARLSHLPLTRLRS